MCGELCFLIFVMCLTRNAVLGNPVPCHPDNRDPYPYTGSKTPYSYVHNGTGETMTIANCRPTQIWMLCRHGTRYPNELTMARMLNLTHIRDHLMTDRIPAPETRPCEKTDFRNWKPCPELAPGKGNHLAAQGEKDLVSLAERFRAKLPTLFGENAARNFKFRSTDTQRTVASMRSFIKGAFSISPEIASIVNKISPQSESMDTQQTVTAKSFLEGAFNDTLIVRPEIVPIANDTLLKIYNTCESWKSIGINKEVGAFINGPEMAKVLADVSRRLGLADNISKEDAFLFYDACRFERAWHLDEPSPWCDVFTDDEMRVFEYEEDLYYYYRVGPGEKINSKLGCLLVRDMLDRFVKLESAKDDDEPSGVFYFTHSHMVMLLLTAMGIGNDTVPLTAANFRDVDRKDWRISLLVPFAANLAAVFHKCESSDTPFKVAFYLNESPLNLEGCKNGVCDWAQLKKKLGAIAASCSMEMCRKRS